MARDYRQIGQSFRGGGEIHFSGAKHISETVTTQQFSSAQQKVQTKNPTGRIFQIFATSSRKVFGHGKISPSSLLFAIVSVRHKGHNADSAVTFSQVIRNVVSKASYKGEAVSQNQKVTEAVNVSFFGSALSVLRFAASTIALFWGQSHDFKALYDEIRKNPLYGDYPEGGTITEDDKAVFTTKSATMTFQDDGVGSYRDGVNPYKEGQFP
jgi:hypothetical protein